MQPVGQNLRKPLRFTLIPIQLLHPSQKTQSYMCKRILFLLTVTCLIAQAADSVPTEASVRELLVATHGQKMVDEIIPQMDAMMQKGLAEALKGQTISPAAQKMIEQNRASTMAMMKEELAWSKLEPIYMRVYQKSLTQEEVNGIIAIYKTPAGQAMITKMPIIMQNTMAELQTTMAPMMQRVQKSQEQLVADIKKEAKPKS